MKHGYGFWFLVLATPLLGAGCSSSYSNAGGISEADAAGFSGIYQTTGYSENSASCDAPGASLLSGLGDKFFLVVPVSELGEHFVSLVSCKSVSECQATRSALTSEGFYSSAYSFTLTSKMNATALAGFEATTGFSGSSDGICRERTYADHILSLNADHSLRLESRTKKLADKPQHDGFCEVEPAASKQEASGLPCSDLKVLEGSFVQAM